MRAVDCVIPAYNPDYVELCQAVRSAKKQKTPCTITLVDDGSHEEGRRVIRQVAAEMEIELISLAENRGAGAARNIGASIGKAEFVWFLDADDWVEPQFLSTAIAHLRKYPEVVAFQSGLNFIGEVPPLPDGDPRFDITAKAIPGNKVIRRWIFHQANGFGTGPAFRGPHSGEDVALYRGMVVFGKIISIKKPLYNLRVSKGDHFWRMVEESTIKPNGRIRYDKSKQRAKTVQAANLHKKLAARNLEEIRAFLQNVEEEEEAPQKAESEDAALADWP